MDALEFARIRRRICTHYDYKCGFCPLGGCDGKSLECTLGIQNATPEDDKETVAFVENWGKEHPAKTRQSEFLKLHPDARMSGDGKYLCICPRDIDKNNKCIQWCNCEKCLKDYWLEEIE